MSLDENHREKLRDEIKQLESEISILEKTIADKKIEKETALAKMQIRLFLERMFIPYVDGLCAAWGVTPEEGLLTLIKENETIDNIAKNNPDALKELLSLPEMQVIITMATPLGTFSKDMVKDNIPILLDIAKELRPELATILETHEGREWLTTSLTGLKKTLFGY